VKLVREDTVGIKHAKEWIKERSDSSHGVPPIKLPTINKSTHRTYWNRQTLWAPVGEVLYLDRFVEYRRVEITKVRRAGGGYRFIFQFKEFEPGDWFLEPDYDVSSRSNGMMRNVCLKCTASGAKDEYYKCPTFGREFRIMEGKQSVDDLDRKWVYTEDGQAICEEYRAIKEGEG